jgi:hypothetical protein
VWFDESGCAPVNQREHQGVNIMADTKKAAPAAKKAGQKGPPSSLETGVGSATGVGAGGDYNHEAKGGSADVSKSMTYSVQVHTDEDGLEVFEIDATSGDEAAQKALAKKNYKGTSIRGVTPASDPDPNSLGGERDASIMIANAENGGDAGINPLGTAANAKAVKELGKADVEELGE